MEGLWSFVGMNKVELAKMIGLEKDYDNCYIQKEDLQAIRGKKGATKKFCQQIINLLKEKNLLD